MSRNGHGHHGRPRIELLHASASPDEAAAIAAAIEQFLHDTAPPPSAPVGSQSPWLRAGLLENAGPGGSSPARWGDPEAWG